MIYRDRTSIAVPGSCDGQNSAASEELQKATAFYNNYVPGEKAYSFKVYKNADISRALHSLFKKKCAYCESYYLDVHPTDIEHFRPKARIQKEGEQGTISPGYWWLAADWSNLLPSCIDCNRKRGHLIRNNQINLGKSDHFPIYPTSNTLRVQGSEVNEIPLLINPCEENPSDYLTFYPVCERPIAKPVNQSGVSRLKAKASIKYFGLNRPELVESRAKTYKGLQRCFFRIERYFKRQEEEGIDFTNEIEEELLIIKEDYLDDSQPYSVACKEMFKLWLHTSQMRGV
ncbi:hypothetical protein PTE01_24900 [Pseudoalteromonas tetraodonis GFC]|uniref:TIGR02646 family protein n=1 Tax=Pseudoalteromonas tetraodonis GFC TaxID=1315271 RepID=A0AA37RZX0_9GAMM|nr:hypothetical protein [Pseudoalteromonas tetraodonis]ATD03648.1 hypothetical protein PTET_a2300 [Pseudoalteromonas tetraodonis]GEN39380.1 hypothetical protein PTE01_24900 [Pseudoalteromonas tetraodonis GFC]GLQ01422.1 hypothetical protein GCM10007914_03030 [Pseudoalteromonas tetraodonis GFC]|tara:strand:+ start:13554 stop:14414 length:861 start_codon:yes stop_codon:yes gene_type:complete